MRQKEKPILKTPQEVRAAVKKELRKTGLTYAELAKNAGFNNRQAIANIVFRNHCYFTPRVAGILHDAFGFSKTFLIHGAGKIYSCEPETRDSAPDLLLVLLEDAIRRSGRKDTSRLLLLSRKVLQPGGTIDSAAYRELHGLLTEKKAMPVAEPSLFATV